MKKSDKNTGSSTILHKVFTVIGIILCVILIPALIINVTLIIRSYTNPDKVPGIGSMVPMVVLTDSMYPEINSGDLIICKTVSADEIVVGDVISFFDPASKGTSVVTHRVIEVTEEGGKLAWRTQGDANNTPDESLVPAANLVGVYNFRIAGAGNVAMFMRSTQGLIICVILPIVLLIGYDMLRRRMYEKKQQQDADALKLELEELRAKANEQHTEDN
ncbi:MAG: signal peptidase I [Clostridia bacterium]|nr:signal peptidase I [Clostridia bacterium]